MKSLIYLESTFVNLYEPHITSINRENMTKAINSMGLEVSEFFNSLKDFKLIKNIVGPNTVENTVSIVDIFDDVVSQLSEPVSIRLSELIVKNNIDISRLTDFDYFNEMMLLAKGEDAFNVNQWLVPKHSIENVFNECLLMFLGIIVSKFPKFAKVGRGDMKFQLSHSYSIYEKYMKKVQAVMFPQYYDFKNLEYRSYNKNRNGETSEKLPSFADFFKDELKYFMPVERSTFTSTHYKWMLVLFISLISSNRLSQIQGGL